MKSNGKRRIAVTDVLLVIILCLVCYVLGMKHGASTSQEADEGQYVLSERPDEVVAPGQLRDANVQREEQNKSAKPAEGPEIPEAERNDIEFEQKQRLMRNLSENLAMPGMSKIIRDQQRILMTELYSDLADTYGLEGEEREYFIDLLTARQMFHVDMGMKLMTGMLSEADRDELLERVGAGIEEMNQEKEWFLNNDEDAEYFRFYEDTEGERTLVHNVSAQLTQAGLPLEEGMDRELIALMHEELSDYSFSVEFEENGEPVFSRFNGENIDTFVRELQGLREPVIRQAAEVLTPEQLEIFADSFDQYVAFYDQRMRMVQQLFNPAQQ